MLVNLLINAAQAITPGNADKNRVCITTRTVDGGAALIEVSDTGAGIRPAVLPHIFDPYFTTKPVGVGTGLGLSICHSIVSSMGGEISVVSRVDEGSTFRLRFPPGAAPDRAPVSSQPARVTELRGRIMIIDDEDMVVRLLARVLGAHELVTFNDAREALVRLQEDGRFDVILCDLMMPNMTGMDFYETLLRSSPDLAHRIVFLTGGAITHKGESFLATVSNQRLQKPFGTEAIQSLIQRVLAQRLED